MQMLRNYVLVSEVTKETTTASGIILTGETSKASVPGLILAIGPDVEDIVVGKRAFLDWSQSMPVEIDGKKAVIISSKFVKAMLA